MIIVPRRSASAPLPPLCSYLAKEGARCVRLRSAPCAYRQPLPHPSPRSRRPSSPLALGRSGRSVRQLAAPPHSLGGLEYPVASLRQDPNPHPLPPLAVARCPPPAPCGGALNYFKPFHSTHLLCVRPAPQPTFCLFSRYRPPQASLPLRHGAGARSKKGHPATHTQGNNYKCNR